MSVLRAKTLNRIEQMVELIVAQDGRGLSVSAIRKELKMDPNYVKRDLNAYCETPAGKQVVERYRIGKFCYYRIRAKSREADLFRGWGGADRLGLK
jgi:chromosome segregation and condensation protein ScpB